MEQFRLSDCGWAESIAGLETTFDDLIDLPRALALTEGNIRLEMIDGREIEIEATSLLTGNLIFFRTSEVRKIVNVTDTKMLHLAWYKPEQLRRVIDLNHLDDEGRAAKDRQSQ